MNKVSFSVVYTSSQVAERDVEVSTPSFMAAMSSTRARTSFSTVEKALAVRGRPSMDAKSDSTASRSADLPSLNHCECGLGGYGLTLEIGGRGRYKVEEGGAYTLRARVRVVS